MPNDERRRTLRLTYQTTLDDAWTAALGRWIRDWEKAHIEFETVDASDIAAVIRLQERIREIRTLISGVESDVAAYRKAQEDD